MDRTLAKSPADRFATCREVIDALAAAPSSTASTAPITAHAARSRALRGGGIVGLAALVLVAAWFGRKAGADARSRSGGVGDAGITLQDRIQLTTTGQARLPAISADGKQLAYVTTQCDDAGCSDGLDVQDVGGIMTHRIFEVTGAALIWLLWSPDRRHLIARGTIGGRSGCWLLSALGGPPHYLNRRASFFAGGDSLLTADSFSADSIFWLRVAGLDGTPHDSIRVAAPAQRLRFLFEVPGTPWIVVALQLSGSGVLIRIIDRQGAISSQIEHTGVVSMRVSRAAIWLQVADRLVRTSLDPASGGLASRSDTLLLGTPAGDLRGVGGTFDITADGGRLVVDNGIYAYDLRAIEWRDLARSPLPGNSILQSSSETFAALAPNGTRLAILQHQDRSAARARVSILPFGGGSPTTLLEGVVEGGWRGIALGAIWSDTTTLALVTRKAGRARFERINVPGGVPEVALTIADSAPESFDWIPSGGWTWIPEGMRRIMWQGSSDSAPRTLAMPASFTYVHVVRASPDGRRLAFWVEGEAGDSLRVVVASLASGELTTWHIFAGEGAQLQWLNDNTIILDVHRAHAEDIYHLTGPGKSRPVGEVRRTVIAFSVSRDMKRAIVGTREYRGDIWMSRVVEH